MKNKIILLILLVGVFAGGFSYWFNPYNDMHFLGIHIYVLMVAGAFLSAMVLTLILIEKPWNIAFLITAGVMIGILGRIIFDMVNDSSTHNMFPFELVISFVITLTAATIGSYLSHMINYFKTKQSSSS